MKSYKRNFLISTLLALGALVSTGALAKTENIEKSFKVEAGGQLVVNSDQGSIEVESWDKNEVFVLVKKQGRKNADFDDFQVSLEESANTVTVIGRSGRSSNVSVDYQVKVPRNFNINLKTGGGSIKVGDMSGEIKVDTSGGSIKIGDIAKGNVDANTSGGSIKVGDVNGNLKVDTSGGSIKLGKISGKSSIETSGGSITLQSGGDNVEAETAGGSIKIGPVNGNVDVDTSGGSIKVEMAQGNVKAETSGGSIDVEGSKGSVRVDTSGGSIKVGSSGGPVTAETAGGSIKIFKANGAIDADTAGGSIEAEMILTDKSADTHVNLTSAGGSITLHIPRSLAATIDARLEITRGARKDYRIYSDFPLTIQGEDSDRIIGKGDLNGGGDKIKLRTVNGDIYIKAIED